MTICDIAGTFRKPCRGQTRSKAMWRKSVRAHPGIVAVGTCTGSRSPGFCTSMTWRGVIGCKVSPIMGRICSLHLTKSVI
jgi:hypothetical protein